MFSPRWTPFSKAKPFSSAKRREILAADSQGQVFLTARIEPGTGLGIHGSCPPRAMFGGSFTDDQATP